PLPVVTPLPQTPPPPPPHQSPPPSRPHPALDGRGVFRVGRPDDLTPPRLQRLAHLLAGGQDFELHINTVLEKNSLLDAYEAWNVVHVVPHRRAHLSGLLRRYRPGHHRRHRDDAN